MTPDQARLVTVAFWAVLLLFFGWQLGAFGGAGREWPRARAFADRAGLPAEAVDATLVRRVVRRQAVGSPIELAVDDALRAQAVRDALHLTAAITVVVAFTLALALAEPDVVDGPLRRVAGWTPIVLLAGLAVVGTVHEATGGPTHWRRRRPVPA